MMRYRPRFLPALVVLFALLSGCSAGRRHEESLAGKNALHGEGRFELVEVASSARQWTGVAVSGEGRIFVCYPRRSGEDDASVVEIISPDQVEPFPPTRWNEPFDAGNAASRFVCVQSVYIDDRNDLWILDSGKSHFGGVIAGGPKLVRIDLDGNRVKKVYPIGADAVRSDSYLDDVRVDAKRGVAYITDAGDGGIVLLDLKSGAVRRVLDDHPSTQSEATVVKVEGEKWKRPDGTAPDVHADGIALDEKGGFLYYHALTGTALYRVSTGDLLNTTLDAAALGAKVERIASTGPVDGMMFGDDGWLYLAAIGKNAVERCRPDGTVETVLRDMRLSWPDSFSRGPRGNLYVTTSQVHRGDAPRGPYRLFRLRDTERLP